MLTEEVITKNFEKFSLYLKKIIGEEAFNSIINELGGEEKVKKCPFGTTIDSGSAYDGALIENVLSIASYACQINDILPESIKCPKQEIYKVVLLSHLSKVEMYGVNDNAWEREKRGMLYKFEDIPGALRSGERSILIAMNGNVKFTPIEFEAMRIMDKVSDDNYSKYFSSSLSMVIRQANEIIALSNKNKGE